LAILCLGLGIGLQTTMFASGDPWLFRPLPYAEPERLAAVRRSTRRVRRARLGPELFAWKDLGTPFSDLGPSCASSSTSAPKTSRSASDGARIRLALPPGSEAGPGRGFTEEEDRPRGPAVCMIRHEMWQGRFAARAGVLET
jgi:hypothetical protein